MAGIRVIDRRSFLAASASCLSAAICRAEGKPDAGTELIAKAAPLVKVNEKWNKPDHLYNFLNVLPDEQMLSLKKALGLLDVNAGTSQLKSKSQDVRDIQKQALWLSNHIVAYPFRDETALNYHSLVTWVADQAGVEQRLIDNASTFILEHEIMKQLNAQLWYNLKEKQLLELLVKLDPNDTIKDKAAIAALGGSAALATLSGTVLFTGFAFYTTMSVTISTVAGFVGMTLPFAAYTGASSLVAFLSGPIGWAIAGLAAFVGLAILGRADPKKTAAFVFQVHSLKVAALLAAGTPEREVFPASRATQSTDVMPISAANSATAMMLHFIDAPIAAANTTASFVSIMLR